MGIRLAVIRYLMMKVKANKNYLQELRKKEEDKQQLTSNIVEVTRTMLSEKKIITKASIVKNQVEKQFGVQIK